MIAIINYGLGNVQAIANIYRQLNVPARLVSSPDELAAADRIILPGVGSFDWAMRKLAESGMRAALDDAVIRQGRWVLGICVGMQMMATASDEGELPGLGWLDAKVRRMSAPGDRAPLQLPHMGWNDIHVRGESALFDGLEGGSRFYFLHSYAVEPAHEEAALATATYGQEFAASVGARNLLGVQFHPEKSHEWGIRLLRNFAGLTHA